MRRISAFAVLFALHAGCSVYDESMVGTDLDASGGNVGIGGNVSIGGTASGGVMGSGANASTTGGSDSGGSDSGGSDSGGSTGDTGGDGNSGGTSSGGAATGGDSGTGGATGGASPTGGSGGSTSTGGTPGTLLIDDMEDTNNRIKLSGGDYWFIYQTDACADTAFGSANQATLPTQRESSKKAMHFRGVGCDAVKVQGGLGLKQGSGGKLAGFDASTYDGIAFWAKTGSAGSTSTILVEVPNSTTHPDGGTCSGSGATACYGHYRYEITTLTDQWQLFELKFSDFSDAGFGANDGATMKTTALWQILFSWDQVEEVDVWLDDIYFFTE